MSYRFALKTVIKEKPFKFYVRGQPTSATFGMEYDIRRAEHGPEINLQSVSFTWDTSGVQVQKDVNKDRVRLVQNGAEGFDWVPGQPRTPIEKDEKNPLELFGKPLVRLAPNGRGEARVWRNPEAYLRFVKNFNLGRAPVLHRPALPEGELKPGQTFKTELHVPDGTYAGIDIVVEMDWRVKSVEGTGEAAVAVIEGSGAATREVYESRMGKMTDGAVSLSVSLKVKAQSGELISAESKAETKWKKDPSGAPTGIMDYDATATITESRQESK